MTYYGTMYPLTPRPPMNATEPCKFLEKPHVLRFVTLKCSVPTGARRIRGCSA